MNSLFLQEEKEGGKSKWIRKGWEKDSMNETFLQRVINVCKKNTGKVIEAWNTDGFLVSEDSKICKWNSWIQVRKA